MEINIKKYYCEKCGNPVFYDKKDAKRHKMNSIYAVSMLLAAFTFLTYLFLEMIATPILSF